MRQILMSEEIGEFIFEIWQNECKPYNYIIRGIYKGTERSISSNIDGAGFSGLLYHSWVANSETTSQEAIRNMIQRFRELIAFI